MRLSIQEAHIYITQELQRQGAFKKDKQFNEATDFAINKAITKFIRGRVKPLPQTDRFQVDETSRNDIQSLIKINNPLTVTKEGDYYTAELPPDFKYLLNDSSVILEDCWTDEFGNPTNVLNEKIWIIKFVDSSKVSFPYYAKIEVNNGTGSSILNNNGLAYKEGKYYYIDDIIKLFSNIGELCYWEKYRDNYYPNSFIIPIKDNTKEASIIIDDIKLASTSSTKTYNVVRTDFENLNEIVPNRNSKNDFIPSLRNSVYSRSLPDSPLSTVYGNRLVVYGSKRFLISQIFIDYVRLPRLVNLSLDYGFDINEDTHDRICDLAVEIIKKQIEDNSLGTNIQHNQIRD